MLKNHTIAAENNQKTELRYGENPHQTAQLWADPNAVNSLAQAKPLQGKAMSYNNYVDANAALDCIRCWPSTQPACVIIKHATPCGIAIAKNSETAFINALATDSVSAFGGIVAINQPLDLATAKQLRPLFFEVLIAPAIEPDALECLQNKKNARILLCNTAPVDQQPAQITRIDGGILTQEADITTVAKSKLVTATSLAPTADQLDDLWFAWQVVRQVKSNAIVLAKSGQALGIGTGQTSRIFSLKIAIMKAQEAQLDLTGAVLASDAFFPFDDCVKLAADHGIKAIIQPGGSKRDSDSIACANTLGLSMVMTGMRHFKH